MRSGSKRTLHLCRVAGNTVLSHVACEFPWRCGNFANCLLLTYLLIYARSVNEALLLTACWRMRDAACRAGVVLAAGQSQGAQPAIVLPQRPVVRPVPTRQQDHSQQAPTTMPPSQRLQHRMPTCSQRCFLFARFYTALFTGQFRTAQSLDPIANKEREPQRRSRGQSRRLGSGCFAPLKPTAFCILRICPIIDT